MSKGIFILLFLGLSGCASITSGTTDDVYIGAYNDRGVSVPADCTVTNDAGTIRTKANRNIRMKKDKDEIFVECRGKNASYGEARNDEARVSIGYLLTDFLILDFCLISCWVDGLSGAWVVMPPRIEVEME